jgi:hypothetical protein
MKSLNSKVNPPVEMESEGITLNSGLDLVSSNLMVDKGALRDCENFEVVDRLGYQTVAGFDRFDGKISPDQVRFRVFELDINNSLGQPSSGDRFRLSVAPNTVFGTVVDRYSDPDTSKTWVVYAELSSESVVQAADALETISVGVSLPYAALTTAVYYVDSDAQPAGETADQTLSKYQTWNSTLRSLVTPLPGQPIGLHWFRDRLYVVTDQLQLPFDAAGVVRFPSGDVVAPIPNMILRSQDGLFCCRILDVVVTSGDFSNTDAKGVLLVEPVPFFDGVGITFNRLPPTSGRLDALQDIPDSTNWNQGSNEIAIALVQARPLEVSDPLPRFAGLWRNKLDIEDGGWEYIETGWKVDYENGVSSFNEIRKIERSVENNFQFAQDSSDTAGDKGKSVAFLNGVPIPTQPVGTISDIPLNDLPGWKDTNDLSTFASTQDALDSVDTRFLQADLPFFVGRIPGQTGCRIQGAIGGIPSGTNTSPVRFTPDESTRAWRPLVFANLNNILGSIPSQIEINGVELEVDYDISVQYCGDIPNGESTDFISARLAETFQLESMIGRLNPQTGNFDTIGGKIVTNTPTPTTFAGWVTDTNTPGANLTPTNAVYNGTTLSLTMGGSTETFGNTRLNLSDFQENLFGVALRGNLVEGALLGNSGDWSLQEGVISANVLGWVRFKLNRIRIKLYYTEPSARYYIVDDIAAASPSVLSADLVSYSVNKGQFSSKDAEGTFQFVNIQHISGPFRASIGLGDTIHQYDLALDSPSEANRVATVTADMELNGLPALNDIVEQASRYQFITANFFAREDWDGFYGVSGAGKAFSFAAFDADNDGDEEQYLQFITTNTIVPDEDRPRHIEVFQNHLALGYKDGTVRLSVPGEPELFDGIAGAVEIGVGDRVTGLLTMRGKALGIFCEKKIVTLLGDDADNFTLETLAPKTGAIEYTVVDMGIPLYCDNRGISTLEQSQKYGNFVGIRMSQKVSPWILPRMTRAEDLFSLAKGAGVVCAVPVRAKNQYRVFFRDGRVLILTMNGDGSLAYTYALYYLNEERDEFIVPIAHSSEVDGDGVERIHLAHFSPRSAINAATSRRVWEFERGYGFDGSWYDAFFDTAFSYNDPFRESTVRKIRADGLTRGYGPYTITVAKDYDEDSYSVTDVPLSLPRNPADSVADDPKPATTMANVAKEGRCLSYRIKRDESQKTLVPPTVYQVLLVQYQVGGKRDA